jgi:Double zinc ribbon
LILFALATLGATVVAFVLYPVLSEARAPSVGDTGTDERELIALEEKKTRLYDAITDLDFERDAAKVSDHDYQTARNDYLAQVAEILTRIDALAPPKTTKRKKKAVTVIENEVESGTETDEETGTRTETGSARACGSCGKSNRGGSKFCMHCGAPLGRGCAECGASLPVEARFCMACGEKVRS